ncbi:MAG: hypothetical protein HDS97_00765 [Bacteroidales bacterium]|nr:hypothetical protein [Bacteroidales bacterium]
MVTKSSNTILLRSFGGSFPNVKTAPLEEGGRALMDEIHAAAVNGDVSLTERSDCCRRSIETDEMQCNITGIAERGGDRQTGNMRFWAWRKLIYATKLPM